MVFDAKSLDFISFGFGEYLHELCSSIRVSELFVFVKPWELEIHNPQIRIENPIPGLPCLRPYPYPANQMNRKGKSK